LLTLVEVFICALLLDKNMAGCCIAKNSTRQGNRALDTELSWVYAAVISYSALQY